MKKKQKPLSLERDFLNKKQERFITLARDGDAKNPINVEARTVELSWSSEAPVDRWFGKEILDHDPSSVRLDRLRDGGALLMDHNTRDQIGVVENVTIDSDRIGRAVVRFGKSARAEEIFNDVVDGIRKKISFMYVVYSMNMESEDDDEITYRATDWEPYEISIVSIPADISVGVGRELEIDENKQTNKLKLKGSKMLKKPGQKSVRTSSAQENEEEIEVDTRETETVDVEQIGLDAVSKEQKRTREIFNVAAQFKGRPEMDADNLAMDFISAGRSVAEFNAEMVKKMGRKPVPSSDIGLNEKEARNFSFVRAINALANPNNRHAQEAAAFEFEASAATAQRMGKASQGIMIPSDVMKSQRDLTVGTATAGGNLVATNLLSGSFIDVLRNRSILDRAGATWLRDLVGNVAIPRMTGGATAYWVAENTAPTESQQAFDQATLTPKTVGAFTDISRRLLIQTSTDVEALVRKDLATALALGIDYAGINGSGSSNQPLGILNTSGIGAVAGGANGATVSWANIVALETAVANANADVDNMAYVTNAAQRGVMKTTPKVAGYPVYLWGEDNTLNGYDALVSNQVPRNLTKGTSSGVCSAILFGNFADLIIGMWGSMDLIIDPYSQSTTGAVRVVALQDCDITVRHPESFAAMKDAL